MHHSSANLKPYLSENVTIGFLKVTEKTITFYLLHLN